MPNTTTNLHLHLTNSSEGSVPVKEWIDGLTGDSENSNMQIIDKAYGDMAQQIAKAGKKVVSYTIGAKNGGWTADNCDYLCDGNNDQDEINAAIQKLPESGGELRILSGTYNISSKISVAKNKVTIKGNGASTVLKRMWNSSEKEGVVDITGTECAIESLQIEGNILAFGNQNNCGLADRGNKNTIKQCRVSNSVIGFNLGGLHAIIGSNTLVDDNIGMSVEGNNNNVACNMVVKGAGTPSDYAEGQETIKCSGSMNIISSNIILGKKITDTGTFNTFLLNKWNSDSGIEIDCGVWDSSPEDQVLLHNSDPYAHVMMFVDGNNSQVDTSSDSLEEHKVNPLVHQNLIIDGNNS